MLEQQKQERIDQLWKEVKESVAKKDYETAISKLEEILKLDETSQDAAKILTMLKESTPSVPAPAPVQTTSGAPKAGDRKVETVNGVEFAFRWCPAGKFMMGYEDGTQHQVTLTKGFWMMETEVTQKQWKAIMGNNPSYFKGDDLPVEEVFWHDCQEFCRKSAQLGLPVQLPTEAQWEYACRAGTTGAYAGNLDEMAWYDSNSGSKTHPVGTKKPNAWGLYDMHGNVWEWCADWDGDYPSGSVTDPAGPSSGSSRVFRGGSWDGHAGFCRSACRSYYEPGPRGYYLGFRGALGQ
ncbi:MAG: SUMF1/EgtB/PvdO family nonheme iron enzyme [Thermoguttaceae bacterium]|nr:SUMF1/EgtB/PvdO family nonheme iron enzyme [Thermoguttaceae bacterium]